MAARPRPRLATCSLAGCFGCHMSLLDLDERLLRLLEVVELDRCPLDDLKVLGEGVDVGLVEGGVCNSENVETLRQFRARCRVLVAVGECGITGGLPSMRNPIPLRECLEEAYVRGQDGRRGAIPGDPELPLLLDKVHPVHEVVRIDHAIPGCPPSAEALWHFLTELLAGRDPTLPGRLIRYD